MTRHVLAAACTVLATGCTARSVMNEGGHLTHSVARYAAVGAVVGGGRELIRRHGEQEDEAFSERLEGHRFTDMTGDSSTKRFTLDDGDVLSVRSDVDNMPTGQEITHVRRTRSSLTISFGFQRMHVELDGVTPNVELQDSSGHTVYSK